MPHFRGVHNTLYFVAFLERDEAGMAEQIAWAKGNPRFEESMLGFASDTAAFFGKVAEADKLMQHVKNSAELAGEQGIAADIELAKAFRASLFGKSPEVRRAARAVTQRSGGVGVTVAIALALSGDASQARKRADKDRPPERVNFVNALRRRGGRSSHPVISVQLRSNSRAR
jgi:hypothetical protein